MTLHVIQDVDLRFIEQAIVAAVREARDLRTERVMVPTIDSRRLRQAAKLAVSLAINDDVWDGAEVLNIPAPKRQQGFVNIEGS
jgi:hypothetical protein